MSSPLCFADVFLRGAIFPESRVLTPRSLPIVTQARRLAIGIFRGKAGLSTRHSAFSTRHSAFSTRYIVLCTCGVRDDRVSPLRRVQKGKASQEVLLLRGQ